LLLCFLASPRLLASSSRGGKQVDAVDVIARESGRSGIPPAFVIKPKSRGVLDPLSRV
jgi:hypothetical protein